MKQKYNIYGTSRFYRDTFYYIVSYNVSEHEAIIIGEKYLNSRLEIQPCFFCLIIKVFSSFFLIFDGYALKPPKDADRFEQFRGCVRCTSSLCGSDSRLFISIFSALFTST